MIEQIKIRMANNGPKIGERSDEIWTDEIGEIESKTKLDRELSKSF
jgi:hypothetical protein